jgi:hypothetical protein
VHAAGVVGDRDLRAGDHRDEAGDVEAPGQVDPADRAHEVALLLRADHGDGQTEVAATSANRAAGQRRDGQDAPGARTA